MPKPRAKRRKGSSHDRSVARGGPAKLRDRRWIYATLAAVVLAIGYGAYAWWNAATTESVFTALAERGQGALQRVESVPSLGGGHLSAGQTYQYQSRFPTSGPHSLTWTRPGVYAAPQHPTQLVHALEHGNIVIYYDAPGDAARRQLEKWAGHYDNQWSGLVVTPNPGLGNAVVLTAWARRLALDAFDPAAAAAFIDAYRGRGPENPVR
jgi:hypothetical protein